MRKNVLPMTAGVFGSLALAAMGSLLVAGTASADLLSVTIEFSPEQNPDGLHDTWRVVAHFDDLTDEIAAVAGVSAQPLHFFTGGGDMYNQGLFAGLPFNDFPSAGAFGGELYDSYVTIGATTFPHNVQFSPDFLGDFGKLPPDIQVIFGSEWGPEFNGAWFFPGSPPMVGSIEGKGDVVLAQWTVDKGVGFHFEGNVSWRVSAPGAGLELFAFSVDNIPAPGAMALLGLAGLAGARRRRRS